MIWRKIPIVSSVILLSVSALSAQTLKQYEYWLDEDYASRVTTVSNSTDIELSIDISSLSRGLHYYNFRAVNSDEEFSLLHRQLFYIPYETLPNDFPLASYEYWLDADYASRTTVPITAESTEVPLVLDFSQMSEGLHYFNFRAKNTNEEFSLLQRQLFYIPYETLPTDYAMACYEYWYDADYAHRTTVPLTAESAEVPLTLDISEMSEGLHYFNFRAKNINEEFSTLQRQLFYIPPTEVESDFQIASYEYWLDNDYAHHKTVPVNSNEANAFLMVDLDGLEQGVHYFTFRAMNTNQEFSAPLRHFIYVQREAEIYDAPIAGYRYTFNSVTTYRKLDSSETFELYGLDIEEPDILDLSTIDANTSITVSADGVRLTRTTEVYFAIQFQNETGGWSMPEGLHFSEDDEVNHTYTTLEIEKMLKLKKAKQGDFHAITFDIENAGSYFINASDACVIALYNSGGTRLTTIQAESIDKVYDIGLAAGTYYAVVYNMVMDDLNPTDNIRLRISTDNSPLPTFAYGDVNHDGYINVTDAAAVVSIILGIPNDDLDLEAADANEDGNITVTDEAAIVNMILEEEGNVPAKARAHSHATDAELIRISDVRQLSDDEYELTLSTIESEKFIGAQFDLLLEYPVTFISATSGDKKHALTSAERSDGSTRFVSLSNANDLFRKDKIMTIIVKSMYPLQEISLANIVLVRENLEDEHRASQLLDVSSWLSLEQINADGTDTGTYDLGGRHAKAQRASIYINNGKKQIQK